MIEQSLEQVIQHTLILMNDFGCKIFHLCCELYFLISFLITLNLHLEANIHPSRLKTNKTYHLLNATAKKQIVCFTILNKTSHGTEVGWGGRRVGKDI